MASAKEMVTGTFRVNKAVKESAETVLQGLGMNLSTAINVFLAQVVREQMLPFQPGEKGKRAELPTSRLDVALGESERILTGDIPVKSYDSFDELWADV